MRRMFALSLLLATACASGVADPSLPEAKATVEVMNLAPAPGSTVDERTVLTADVRYSIENFQSGADYYVAPLFASTEGEGSTFNELERFSDAPRLASPTGTVAFRYPIDRELRDAKLARPIRVWLFVMERTGAHTTRVIGEAGPFEYRQ